MEILKSDNTLRFAGERDQLDLVAEIAAAVAQRISGDIEPAAPSMPFGELFSLYYEKHCLVRNKRPDRALCIYKNHASKWADTPVSQITRKDMDAWMDDLLKKVGKSRANDIINATSTVINWGIKRGYLSQQENPCKAVDRVSVLSRDRFLSPAEFGRVVTALKKQSPLIRDFFLMCLYTGARKTNVLEMSWEHIDLDLAVWRIPGEQFKNGITQNIPLGQDALKVLIRRSNNGSQWVFPSHGKTGHLVYVRYAWRRICKQANIENSCIHDLRRTVGSYMAMQGESPYVIAQMLGHKDLRSTAIYARLNLEPVRNAAEKVFERWRQLSDDDSESLLQETEETASLSPINQKTDVRKLLIQAKILQRLKHGDCTKRDFYQKLGGVQFETVSNFEMSELIDDLVQRQLISRSINDRNVPQYSLTQSS